MIEEILAERHKIHGDFTEDARISQAIKAIYHGAKSWANLTSPQREALEHIATKTARILAGNPNHQDHWNDIAGYAKLVSQRLSPPLSSMEMDDLKKIADRFKSGNVANVTDDGVKYPVAKAK